jgi:hypothetical protein
MGFSLLEALIYGPFRRRLPYFFLLWVTISGADAVASGTFFGLPLADFIYSS